MNEIYLYQEQGQFFGQLGAGAEELGVQELTNLGARNARVGYRGVHFEADPATLYAIIYQCRLFTRILAPLFRFDCHSANYLYKRALDMDWQQLLSLDQTFSIQAVTVHSAIHHSRFAALKLKDAIADHFRQATGERPSVDARDADVALHLYIERNRAVISLDLSAGSLHRRGYRVAKVDAPMQETTAATLVAASGWTGELPLIDPFCGSGTILCEAWMAACQIPTGVLRTRNGLTSLPDYDSRLWQQVKAQCDSRIQVPPTLQIRGSDIDSSAVAAARQNLAKLPEGKRVEVSVADARKLRLETPHQIITNPPYGVRIGDADKVRTLLKDFGDTLKQHCAGSQACIYYGEPGHMKSLGLKPHMRQPLQHGGLDGQCAQYRLFAGPARPPQ